MDQLPIGELAAVATAVLWTFSAVAWTSAGRYVGALAVSFVRLLITCVFLLLHGQLVLGQALPLDASGHAWTVLGLSGFLGFFVSDLCLFKALLILGPRLSLLIYSLTPPMTAILARLFLDEQLAAVQWLAMGITLGGVAWVVCEQPDDDEARHTRRTAHGVVLAVLGAAWQAVAVILSKAGLGDCDPAAATFIRVLGGMAGYLVLVTLLGRWPAMLATLRQPRLMAILSGGALVGPYLGVTLYLVALRRCPAGVVATIVATMPVLILPFAIVLYREKVSLRAVFGAVLSVVGVALLMSP